MQCGWPQGAWQGCAGGPSGATTISRFSNHWFFSSKIAMQKTFALTSALQLLHPSLKDETEYIISIKPHGILHYNRHYERHASSPAFCSPQLNIFSIHPCAWKEALEDANPFRSRLVALPFIFYGGTFVGRCLGDVLTGRNAEFARERFLASLPAKVFYAWNPKAKGCWGKVVFVYQSGPMAVADVQVWSWRRWKNLGLGLLLGDASCIFRIVGW